ncbi:MAG TPA: glycosyl hydrolase 53 family protein [Opitutales bacterium]|nr:glycosyl hydrolase 53 family protein [Opitutales bacterium]
MKIPRLISGLAGLALAAAATAQNPAPATPTPRAQPYILGADISWVYRDETAGAEYFDQGARMDIFDLLKKYRFNYVRLGVLVDSDQMNFDAGFNLTQLKVFAKRVKDAKLGLLIDFMMGDTWTSPEGQPKPAAWAKLAFPELAQAVHDHVKEVLLALKEQGTTPDMVQIGNEITFGMLWPDGRVTSKISTGNPDTDAHNANVTDAGGWDKLGALLRAGVAAVKEVDPRIKIMLHHSLARNDALVHEWLDKLAEQKVDFDIVGLSCYAEHNPDDWKTTFADIAKNYPRLSFIAVEYSPKKRYVNDLVFNAPNGKGLGSFIWEPTRSQETIFDRPAAPAAAVGTAAPAGTAPRRNPNGGRYDTNALIELYPQMAKDYGN